MLLHRGQQIDEAAPNMRPDGLILQRAGQAEHHAFVGGHGEMIGPEVHQALGKRAGGERRALSACQHLRAVVGLIGLTNGVAQLRIGGWCGRGFHSLTLLAGRKPSFEDLIGRRQRRIDRQWDGTLDLGLEPGAGVCGRRRQITGLGTQSKAQYGDFSLHHAMQITAHHTLR